MPPGRGSSAASVPFQRSSRSGSVTNSNTVSGRAAIRISRVTTPVASTATRAPPFLGLGGVPEPVEPLVPEVLHEGSQLGEALGAGPIQPPGAVATLDE